VAFSKRTVDTLLLSKALLPITPVFGPINPRHPNELYRILLCGLTERRKVQSCSIDQNEWLAYTCDATSPDIGR
jgi:hypothetical protein